MEQKAIEQEIQAKGLIAPRVTPDDIEANIVGEHYHCPSDYTIGCGFNIGSFDHEKIKRHTICILTLRNGFTVVGINEGPVSASNFDVELGRKLARKKAVDQIWPVMGYELRTQLAVKEREAAHFAAQGDVDRRISAINRGDKSAKFEDDELVYAASARCICGAGMAYPKAIGLGGSWHCSDILTFRALTKDNPEAVGHDSPMPFMSYSVKSENQPSARGATTRPASAEQ